MNQYTSFQYWREQGVSKKELMQKIYEQNRKMAERIEKEGDRDRLLEQITRPILPPSVLPSREELADMEIDLEEWLEITNESRLLDRQGLIDALQGRFVGDRFSAVKPKT